MKTPLLLSLLSVSSLSFADTIFDTPHDWFVATLEQGETSGELRGMVAEHFTRELKSQGILRVNAKTIASLDRPGCQRIQAVFTKEGVETPQGVTEAILTTEINYCLDGKPPVED